MPNKCCVYKCSKPNGFKFPSNVELRKSWIAAVRRDKWIPTANSSVCSDHFQETDFMDGPTAAGSLIRKRRRLNPDAVPSIFMWTEAPTESQERRRQRARKRELVEKNLKDKETQSKVIAEPWDGLITCETGVPDVQLELEVGISGNHDLPSAKSPQKPMIHDPSTPLSQKASSSSTQTDHCQTESAGTQTAFGPSSPPLLSVESLQFDDAMLHYYTGLETFKKFTAVFRTLGPAVNHLRYLRTETVSNISPINQFLLMLAKLRQDLDYLPLSRMCGVSIFTVENVYLTWVNFCSRQWREIETWPSAQLVRFFSPSDFKSKFPTTRVVLDGTEIPIERPSNPLAQRASFSTYKNKNTVKVIVGVTPGGLVSYVSQAYGGSTSDRQIIERSDLAEKCDAGDSIMADKGFNVQDLFASHDIEVNIPAFFAKKNRLTEKQVLDDRKISSKRVHVERVIGMAKTYKILVNGLNASETKIAHHIVFVCFTLCNFRQNIVSTNA